MGSPVGRVGAAFAGGGAVGVFGFGPGLCGGGAGYEGCRGRTGPSLFRHPLRENTEALGPAYRRHGPGRKARGHAERRRSGPVPSRPSPSGPHHWRADPWSLPLEPDRANATPGRYTQVTSWGLVLRSLGRSRPRSRAGSPDHEQAKEAAMSVVSFALTLPVVLLFVAMFAYVLARALLLVGPPGAHRHRPPRRRHP
jgi:hypothetical protein